MKKIQYSLHQFQLVSLICAKATPHNSSAALAMPFSPSAACRFLDLPPVNLRNLQLHLTKNSFATALTHLCGVALTEHQVITRKETQVLLDVSQSTAGSVLKAMVDNGQVKQLGGSRTTRYELSKK